MPLRSTLLAALALTATCTSAELRADDDTDRGASGSSAEAIAPRQDGLSIAVRVENGNQRSFRQYEPTTGELRTFDAHVYGGVGVALGYERSFGDELLSWSVSGDYWRSLLFTSGALRVGKPVDTTAERMSALAGLAVHPGATTDSGSLGLVAGVAAMRFDFDLPEPSGAEGDALELATGNYTMLSTGAEVRVPCAAFALSLRLSHLLGLHTGAFGSREVDRQPRGVDALAVLDYSVLPWLAVFVRADAAVLWLDLAPIRARATDLPAEVRDLYLALGLGGRARF